MPDMSMRTPQSQIVDMSENFSIDTAMDELVRRRFAMSPVAIAAFRQAAAIGVKRLLFMVADDATFNKMSTSDKLKTLEMVFDRAYGKTETASTSELTNFRTGQGKDDGKDHAQQLDAIHQRMMQQQTKLTSDKSIFPELRSKRAARDNNDGNVVLYKSPPPQE